MNQRQFAISSGVISCLLLSLGLLPDSAPSAGSALVPNEMGRWAVAVPSSVLAAGSASPLSGALLANLASFDWGWTDPTFADVSGFFTASPLDPGAVLSSADLATYQSLSTDLHVPTSDPVVVARPLASTTGGSSVLLPLAIALIAGRASMAIAGVSSDDVCMQQNDALEVVAGVLDGVDCAAFDNAIEQSERNADLVPTQTFDPVTVGGVSVNFVGSVPWTGTTYNSLTCFRWSGVRPPGYKINVMVTGSAGSSNSTGTNESNSYCPPESNLSGRWVTAPLLDYQVILTDNVYPWSDPPIESEVVTGVWGLPDPLRQWRCTINTTTGSHSSLSATFSELDDTLAAVECPIIPDGETITDYVLEEIGGPDNHVVVSRSVTSAYSDWRSQFSYCANGSCLLDLRLSGSSCFLIANASDCAYWKEAPENFSCWIGTIAVPLSECNVYATTFNYGVVQGGDVYADPGTGNAVPHSSPTEQDELEFSLFDRIRHGKGWVTGSAEDRALVVAAVAAQCLSQTTLKQCRKAVYAPGSPVSVVAGHAATAILSGRPFQLTYVERDVRKYEISRTWYATAVPPAETTCTVAGEPNQDCDEYPYFSTEEGGPPGASLLYLDRSENQTEGGYRSGFYGRCEFSTFPRGSEDREFVVVPTVVLPLAYWCAE